MNFTSRSSYPQFGHAIDLAALVIVASSAVRERRGLKVTL
jgi:hypothetical protein